MQWGFLMIVIFYYNMPIPKLSANKPYRYENKLLQHQHLCTE